MNNSNERYFPFDIQINRDNWKKHQLDAMAKRLSAPGGAPAILFFRYLANSLNKEPKRSANPVKAGTINLFALLTKILRYLFNLYTTERFPEILQQTIRDNGLNLQTGELSKALAGFAEHFPGSRVLDGSEGPEFYSSGDDQAGKLLLAEFLLLRLSLENPALKELHEIFDDRALAESTPFAKVTDLLDAALGNTPPFEPFEHSLMNFLRLPMKFSPSSLAGQLEYIKTNWADLLPFDLLSEIVLAFDILREEEREWWGGPGRPQVLEFGKGRRAGEDGYDYPEFERFSADADWMSNVVMIAKMVYVWMDQLSRQYGREISRLDQIPDEELDKLAGWGFNAIWLIGLWERSPASQKIKQLCGNPEAVSSAYSLYDYTIAADLGGEQALRNLKERARRRGIRLASDMVPNHTGIYSRWTREHPDWFVQLDYPPYPSYSFTGPDLSFSPEISLFIEDGYWNRTDAAVVFKHVDNHSGRTRFIYHGNDGTSTPWNDTGQLNYLIAEVREAVIRTIIHVARQFPIIRFDAAMTLAKKHYQRLWFPQPGHGSGVPSRAEHGMSRESFDSVFPLEFWREVVDRMAVEAPDTLLLAEAFWLMEGYFVRTLGMHRVYNSAFMNMLKMEENAKYRQTIKNILEFNPEILKRFVNFMSNPDERTAIDQFGKEGKYFGAAVLLTTMPGLPMFGHGQIEGFTEKYGMEYRRAYWQEEIDRHLVEMHEQKIFPLMKKRYLFSGSENFVLYDFHAGEGVDENVFAYSNRSGGERGLVIYHNKFATTAGWIRLSCAGSAKGGDGNGTLVRKTLGEALGLNADGRFYYSFVDCSTGLEYLRHGRELVEQGLYAELQAFEYHTFVDFREIRDDDYGTWGNLCRRLEGRPVESLRDELKQVRYAAIISAMEALAAALPGQIEVLFDTRTAASAKKSARESLRTRLTALLTTVCKQTGGGKELEEIVSRAIAELDFAARLADFRPRRRVLRSNHCSAFLESALVGVESGFNRLFLAFYLILHRIGLLDGKLDYHLRPADWMDEFGLKRTLRNAFHHFQETRGIAPLWGSGTELLMMEVLFTNQLLFEGTPPSLPPASLFEDEKSRQFLLVNRSNGVEWFNKERFEDLMSWLYLTGTISACAETAEKDAINEKFSTGCETLHEFLSHAESAHYRTDYFRATR